MKTFIYWAMTALIYVPLYVWLEPPWYGAVAIGVAAGMLADLWVSSLRGPQ